MIYALNLFNFVAGKEEMYRRYNAKASKIVYRLGGRLVCAGNKPVKYLTGDIKRDQLIIVEFPSPEVFEQFHAEAEKQGLHQLREASTCDYIWILFEPWSNLSEWIKGYKD